MLAEPIDFIRQHACRTFENQTRQNRDGTEHEKEGWESFLGGEVGQPSTQEIPHAQAAQKDTDDGGPAINA